MKIINVITVVILSSALLFAFSSCRNSAVYGDISSEQYCFEDIDDLLADDYSEGTYQHNLKMEIAVLLMKEKINETYAEILDRMDMFYVTLSENENLPHYSRDDYESRFIVPFKEYYNKQMSVLSNEETTIVTLSELAATGGTAGASNGLYKVYLRYRDFYDCLESVKTDF